MPTRLSLREVRRQHQLSMQALAASSGVHWMTIWRAERGRNIPLPIVQRSIAQALGKTPDQINWNGQPPAA